MQVTFTASPTSFTHFYLHLGGPYFEILSQMCTDIQSAPLSLFIPCPNAQIATEQEGSVTNRDKVRHILPFLVIVLISHVVHTESVKKEPRIFRHVQFYWKASWYSPANKKYYLVELSVNRVEATSRLKTDVCGFAVN
jgi:hypothetical protein